MKIRLDDPTDMSELDRKVKQEVFERYGKGVSCSLKQVNTRLKIRTYIACLLKEKPIIEAEIAVRATGTHSHEFTIPVKPKKR